MSVLRQIIQLKNLIGIKKAIIIEGNVEDIIEYDDKYISIQEVLFSIFNEKNYKDKFIYDQNIGIKGNQINNLLINEDSNNNADDFNSLFGEESSDNENELRLKKPYDFFNILYKNLSREDDRKMGFIADYSDFVFSDQSLEIDDRKALTEFNKSLKEKEFKLSKIDDISSCVVFLTKKINQLPPSLYLDNPEIIIITLPKPSRDERKKFLTSVKSLLRLTDLKQEFENIVDATEGWTLRELSHFVKFTCNFSTTLEFNKIFNIYNYGEKSSPWEELSYDKMLTVKEYLKNKVIGQDEAVEKVSKVIYKAYTGLSGITYSSKRSKPKGTLFFVGPTGTGKTELAKAITTFLFNDEANLIRFDMSEYGQENADQKLIGAPPGYVGFEGGGQLTNAIKEKPFSVLLFDEIEKANPKIFDKFLQILEDGRLTDNTGQTVSFSETFIIFTSNIGASEVQPNIGESEVHNQFIKKVHEHFTNELNRPELLGRFGNNIIPFNFIKDINLKAKIIKQKIKPLQIALYEKYGTEFHIDLSNINIINILLKSADDRRGGRDVLNSLETNLVDKLSQFIFENLSLIKPGTKITTQIKNDELEFNLLG
ncbi:AAA family ATPase [Spiroplasma turonicum]|uniref:ATPase AAA-2 domain-containing protein n=1 Tax=Spiroplasma turonicum TaxID=216946 RepID=A0A0K1P7D9_9MOLU|nr:AAA family ATPase [Spiroplasma turonicum]AKU80221.1 ATPase AAA-2 domain-containing protein [Spiroplasma turonicum]ALX71221.1 AAA family ATPase [Spiroplasma turonicum]